jgi:hypothetical protein
MRSIAHFRLGQMEEAEYFVAHGRQAAERHLLAVPTLCAQLGDRRRTEEAAAIADRLRLGYCR